MADLKMGSKYNTVLRKFKFWLRRRYNYFRFLCESMITAEMLNNKSIWVLP